MLMFNLVRCLVLWICRPMPLCTSLDDEVGRRIFLDYLPKLSQLCTVLCSRPFLCHPRCPVCPLSIHI